MEFFGVAGVELFLQAVDTWRLCLPMIFGWKLSVPLLNIKHWNIKPLRQSSDVLSHPFSFIILVYKYLAKKFQECLLKKIKHINMERFVNKKYSSHDFYCFFEDVSLMTQESLYCYFSFHISPSSLYISLKADRPLNLLNRDSTVVQQMIT